MLEFKHEQLLKENIFRLNKITKIISTIRLILAIVVIIFTVCFMSLNKPLLYGLISLSVFIILIIIILFTNRYYQNLSLLEKKQEVYQIHYRRRNKELSSFFDGGSEYLDINNYSLADLDIFGAKSLFSYLNSTKTKIGRAKLVKQLINPVDKNIEFTKSIVNLGNNEEILDIEAALLEFKNSSKNIDYNEFNSLSKININLGIKKYIPLISFITMIIYTIVSIIFNLPISIIFIFLFANYIMSKLFLNNEIYQIESSKYYSLCDSYLALSDTILRINVDDEYFNINKEIIKDKYSDLKNLRSIYLSLSTRKNFIFNIIFNSLFIFDFWFLYIYNYKTKNVGKLDFLYESIGEIELVLSFSNLVMDSDIYCIPVNSEYINAKEIYHPLIKDCVTNDICFNKGIILTGSNMSGKTTFMRTIGVNQILFNAGSVCCAKEFSSYKMPIFTSLRANDMLVEGVSTFYAEILRMKKINTAIKNYKCLILIDEIFKGTNANERILASFKIIDKLVNNQILFIISTHDFDLCEAKLIDNYHFEELYIDDKISFDYKIKEGKCNSTNAIYLLKLSGILE